MPDTFVLMVVFSDASSGGAGAVYLEGTEHVCWSQQDKTTTLNVPNFRELLVMWGVRSGVLVHLSLRMVLFSENSSEVAGAGYPEGCGECVCHHVGLSRRQEIMSYNFHFISVNWLLGVRSGVLEHFSAS